MAEIIHHLALASGGREQKGGTLPIGQGHAERLKHAIGDRDPVLPFPPALRRGGGRTIRTGTRTSVRPMHIAADHAAERTHARLLNRRRRRLTPGTGMRHFFRGERFLKSSAISSMVTKRTPGCRIIWP